MVATESTMMPLGTKAPDFTLPDTDGSKVSLADFEGSRALVVMFICNHCPFVKHVADQLARLARDYSGQGVGFVAINSNDAEAYPDDSPAKMAQEKIARGYTFPYLFDATQQVAKDYRAACTPDFYVFDADQRLAYCGRLDQTRPFRISSGNYDSTRTPSDGADLRAALDALLNHQRPSPTQHPSMGCNIKWRPGNEPDYFG